MLKFLDLRTPGHEEEGEEDDSQKPNIQVKSCANQSINRRKTIYHQTRRFFILQTNKMKGNRFIFNYRVIHKRSEFNDNCVELSSRLILTKYVCFND